MSRAVLHDGDERVTALLCESSAWLAWLEAREDPELACIDAIRLPCTGAVDTVLLLHLLEQGARGVIVLGCPKDSCEFARGSHRAEKRVAAARAALRDAGISEKRIGMEFVSSVEGPRLAAVVRSFIRGISP